MEDFKRPQVASLFPKKNIRLEERRKIEELLKEPISLSEIARQLNRSKNTLITEVRINGGRAEYKAIDAQKRSFEAYQNRRETLRKHDMNSRFRIDNMVSRLTALEMQMDIILDIIKKLEKIK